MSIWLWWRLIKIQSRNDAPLTALVRELDPVLRNHIDHLGIHFRGETVEVSLRFALFLRHDARRGESPWIGGDQPTSADLKRWPTLIRELPLELAMAEQLENLEDSGLVGELSNTRNHHGNNFAGLRPKRSWGPTAGRSWRLMTHAGTAAERQAWQAAIQDKTPSTDGSSVIESITSSGSAKSKARP